MEPQTGKKGIKMTVQTRPQNLLQKRLILGGPVPWKTRLPPEQESNFHIFEGFQKGIQNASKMEPKWHPFCVQKVLKRHAEKYQKLHSYMYQNMTIRGP